MPSTLEESQPFVDGEALHVLRSRIQNDDVLRAHPKRLRTFYQAQNRLIDVYLKHGNVLIEDAPNSNETGQGKSFHVTLAANSSFMLNVVLMALKIVAVVLSNSMAIIASAADSILDLVSGLVFYFVDKAIKKKDPKRKYPQGKARLEPIGVLVFSTVMGVSSVVIIIEALRVVASGAEGNIPVVQMDGLTWFILCFTVMSKLAVMLYCGYVGKKFNSAIAATYAQEHRNDTVTNTVSGLCVLAAVSSKSLWLMDSLGAILISGWIIVSWAQTGMEHVSYLAGRSASTEFLNEVTFIASNHHPEIIEVDTVKAYHFGTKFLTEVDIVMSPDTPLRRAHDIGESLQFRLEKLESVERAFVHIDVDSIHKPEH